MKLSDYINAVLKDMKPGTSVHFDVSVSMKKGEVEVVSGYSNTNKIKFMVRKDK